MAPKATLALIQHQINWWERDGNFNLGHFEKVLEARAKRSVDAICIFHSPLYKPKVNLLNNNRFIKHHQSK